MCSIRRYMHSLNEYISDFPFQQDMNIGNTVRSLVVHYLDRSHFVK